MFELQEKDLSYCPCPLDFNNTGKFEIFFQKDMTESTLAYSNHEPLILDLLKVLSQPNNTDSLI